MYFGSYLSPKKPAINRPNTLNSVIKPVDIAAKLDEIPLSIKLIVLCAIQTLYELNKPTEPTVISQKLEVSTASLTVQSYSEKYTLSF